MLKPTSYTWPKPVWGTTWMKLGLRYWLRREDCLRAKCFWAWRFGLGGAQIYAPDLIRLGTDRENVQRLIGLGLGSGWTIRRMSPFSFTLSATRQLIREERRKRPYAPVATQQERAISLETPYVAESRIAELESLTSTFDTAKLVAICKELNVCWDGEAVYAIAALVRSIIDHVPPVFGVKTFVEVVNNYPGTRSFRDSMQHLTASARKIADAHLHTQMRPSEVLPTPTQVNFSRELDVLLAEIVRILKRRSP